MNGRINGHGKCVYCNSILSKFPSIAKELSTKNPTTADCIHYGTTQKYLWECGHCKHEWMATVNSRTCNGNGCPKCSKIKIKNGMTFDSKTEAYVYLQISSLYDNVIYNKSYGLGNLRCDFYIPAEDLYIEVTSFHKKSKNVNYYRYLRNIVRKKIYVENNCGKFKFMQIRLSKKQEKILLSQMI